MDNCSKLVRFHEHPTMMRRRLFYIDSYSKQEQQLGDRIYVEFSLDVLSRTRQYDRQNTQKEKNVCVVYPRFHLLLPVPYVFT